MPKQPRLHYDYILGNPPFIGSKIMRQDQRDDVVREAGGGAGSGTLDYVAAWYLKAARCIQNTDTKVAFVSTNSIVQGEQVAALWGPMLHTYGIHIHFAHRTFKWSNEAKGNAAVYCVIIGFAAFDTAQKTLYEYEDIRGEAHAVPAKNINPYLVDAKDLIINGRPSPLVSISRLLNGSIPADGGNLILDKNEREKILANEPNAQNWIRPYLGAEGFINGDDRSCLWLKHCSPSELKAMPLVLQRVAAVKEMRSASTKIATQKKAATPTLFTEDRQPEGGCYLAIPRTSSERRKFIPIGVLSSDVIAANDLQIVPNASMYEFGILTSEMHMAWVRLTSGRLKSDIRYSALFTYNTFPWPKAPSAKTVAAIEAVAQGVLDARAQFPHSSLADLYDPIAMPPVLSKAHEALDRAVDKAYGGTFTTEAKRMEHLFALYEEYVAGLFMQEKKKAG